MRTRRRDRQAGGRGRTLRASACALFGLTAGAVLLVLAGAIPAAAWYGLLSLLAFALYAFDKHAARTQRRRVPEAVLLASAGAGGWPGGWLAQRLLRHKSSKASFLLRFRLALAINLIGTSALAALFAHLAEKI